MMKKNALVKAVLLAGVVALATTNLFARQVVAGPDCPGSGDWCAVDPDGNWYVKALEN